MLFILEMEQLFLLVVSATRYPFTTEMTMRVCGCREVSATWGIYQGFLSLG